MQAKEHCRAQHPPFFFFFFFFFFLKKNAAPLRTPSKAEARARMAVLKPRNIAGRSKQRPYEDPGAGDIEANSVGKAKEYCRA